MDLQCPIKAAINQSVNVVHPVRVPPPTHPTHPPPLPPSPQVERCKAVAGKKALDPSSEASGRGGAGSGSGAAPVSRTPGYNVAYVGNVSYEVTDKELLEVFKPWGECVLGQGVVRVCWVRVWRVCAGFLGQGLETRGQGALKPNTLEPWNLSSLKSP